MRRYARRRSSHRRTYRPKSRTSRRRRINRRRTRRTSRRYSRYRFQYTIAKFSVPAVAPINQDIQDFIYQQNFSLSDLPSTQLIAFTNNFNFYRIRKVVGYFNPQYSRAVRNFYVQDDDPWYDHQRIVYANSDTLEPWSVPQSYVEALNKPKARSSDIHKPFRIVQYYPKASQVVTLNEDAVTSQFTMPMNTKPWMRTDNLSCNHNGSWIYVPGVNEYNGFQTRQQWDNINVYYVEFKDRICS